MLIEVLEDADTLRGHRDLYSTVHCKCTNTHTHCYHGKNTVEIQLILNKMVI